MQNQIEIAADLLRRAKTAGIESADVLLGQSQAQSVQVRLGKTETLEREENTAIGLRAFIGKKQAVVSGRDLSSAALQELAERAAAMAALAPEDPYCGLADASQLAKTWPSIDSFDPAEPSVQTLIDRAKDCEDAARSMSGITNSEGASSGWESGTVTLLTSHGLQVSYKNSHQSLSVSVVAGTGTGMERDYDYTVAIYGKDLEKPEKIGRTAGERAVKRLGARKMPTTKVPVVFEAREAEGLLGHFLSAINGAAVARGTSFLKDFLGRPVFGSHITIQEDPLRPRGLASRPVDAEGLLCQKRNLIENGVLTTWLLDCRAARQLAMQPTGHASRGPGSQPRASASNVCLNAGQISLTDLIKDIKQGFYVTDLVGGNVNDTTGDYSHGASGFWIENGAVTFPVSEMTIAGNLKDMFMNLTPAHDLEWKRSLGAPSVRIEGMTVAGL